MLWAAWACGIKIIAHDRSDEVPFQFDDHWNIYLSSCERKSYPNVSICLRIDQIIIKLNERRAEQMIMNILQCSVV